MCGDYIKGMKEDLLKKIYYFLWDLIGGDDPEEIKNCLPPCLTMIINKKKTYYLENNLDLAFLHLNTNEKVTVLKDVYSYDLFDLVVDLGSALGLWLGLSALGIFDFIIMFFGYAKTKFYQ